MPPAVSPRPVPPLVPARRRPTPRRRGTLLLAGVAAASGCRSVTDPALPAAAVSFVPPAVYARWWAMTEACSGQRGDVAAVRWFVVPGVGSFPSPGGAGPTTGYYSRPGNQIVLAGQHRLDGGTVRHEMLHALLRSSESAHPRAQFLERCGGTVRCEAACVQDAGPAPAGVPNVARVQPTDVVLRSELAPAGAGTAGEDAWYTLTVTATNPTSVPVEVALAPLGFAPNFGYLVTTDPPVEPAPGRTTAITDLVPTRDPGVTRFTPGESKRHVFDFRVLRDTARLGTGPDGDVRLPAGAYLFRGRYGDAGAVAPAVAARLAP